MTLDPILLAVVQNGLHQVANEMDMVHAKTSFSPVISEGLDRANGIYERGTGDVIAQGDTGLAHFIGVMQFSTRHIVRLRDDLEEDDIIIMNDPYLGGTHLMDVRMLMPFYYKGKLWSYLSNTGHWPDTGGMVPGGFASTATEIQQEGLRIPPVKLFRRGVMDRDLLDMILANIRVPDERIGDLKAQVGALKVGARRLTELLDRYGADTVDQVVKELKGRSEKLMRARVQTIPPGVYESTSYCDGDGIVFEKLAIRLKMTVNDSTVEFDFSESSPPCRGAMNAPADLVASAVYVAMKHAFPDVPINAGCFAPLTVLRPEGTFLDARYPLPSAGASAEVSQRVIEAVFGALGQAMPERMYAAPAGTAANFSLGGYEPKGDRRYIMYAFNGGGYGGWWAGDGLTHGPGAISNSKSQPVEIMEQHYPILYEQFSLREDSSGAGKYRGGFGIVYKVRLLRGEATASFLMDHGVVGPPGLLGGNPGAKLTIEVCQGGTVNTLPHVSKGEGLVLRPGDWVRVRTPGGGGYGPPRERSREAIERDVRRGLITQAKAEADYGAIGSETTLHKVRQPLLN